MPPISPEPQQEHRPVRWLGTPFAARTAALNRNALWMSWDRMMIADVFTDLSEELHTIRTGVAIGDMSPLSKYEIHGKDAVTVVDRLITRDASKLQIGQTYYTPWCNDEGKLVNDGLVIRVDASTFRLSADPNLLWLRHCAEGYDVEIHDLTEDYGIITLQGPKSTEVLEAASGADWGDLRFSRLRTTSIGGCDVDVLRQGFTGEVGYELWMRAEDGISVWDAVFDAGERYDIKPAGGLAEDVARIEAGLLIVGYDYTAAGLDSQGASVQVAARYEATPFELGLGRLVDFSKEEFIGKAALVREAATGSRTHNVGLEIDWRTIVRECERRNAAPPNFGRVRWVPLPLKGDAVGNQRASSITWSPTTGKLIGFGHVPPASAAPGNTVTVLWPIGEEQVDVPAVVVDLPFVTRRRSTSLS
ncbi:glycine cleavage system protein T [Mycobacterium aquaticum]|uniref:Glycine cleavage system protein T n=1 Tax=Mycobacterium aquaticum TaxID=1927124 RepID=A0A1X0BB26_9MYCO|nr:glycine cleavage system protein T [Mycobacterium aquaticum]